MKEPATLPIFSKNCRVGTMDYLLRMFNRKASELGPYISQSRILSNANGPQIAQNQEACGAGQVERYCLAAWPAMPDWWTRPDYPQKRSRPRARSVTYILRKIFFGPTKVVVKFLAAGKHASPIDAMHDAEMCAEFGKAGTVMQIFSAGSEGLAFVVECLEMPAGIDRTYRVDQLRAGSNCRPIG